jgi:predicted DNA-binding transcriptional regulator AlpA
MPNENNRPAPMPSPVSEPLTEGEAAARLGLKVATLRAWRHQRRGPAFVRLGRAVRYLAVDIDEFLAANRHHPTSSSKM